MKRVLFAAFTVTAATLAFAWAAGGSGDVRADGTAIGADTRGISEKLSDPTDPASLVVDDISAAAASPLQQEPGEAEVGDQARWFALSDTGGFFYLKTFELRATNESGEIWIAVGQGRNPDTTLDGYLGLNFPTGDCRNDGLRNVVTDVQAQYLLDEFTNNIKPIDEDWFGEPNFRDGVGAPGGLDRPSPSGKQVVLVDNVRDDNFYDTNNANSLTYIAGFFTSAMDFFHDRNVMSIDGFDWLHRTTADPPHAPSSDPCLNAPARPFLYEGVFAHEYQHLIMQDYDADELNWVNEGMADLAILLTGYSDPSQHVDEKGNDNHILNFQGWASVAHPDWNPIPRASGPENSLTSWEDQGPLEILEDYGFAYSFMLYMFDHGYGQDFFTAWHHNPLNGIAGLNDTLGDAGSGDTFESVFDDVIAMALADAYIDAGADVDGESEAAIQSDSLNSTIFVSGNAYDTPGAPPWGADFLPLGRGNKFEQLEFDGADQFVFPAGNDWTVDGDGYWTNPDEPGGTIYPSDLDSSIARQVAVPAAPATLTFEHWYQTELGWDFGFVQVLAGDDLVSLPCTGTTANHNPAANPVIAAEVPGYTGPTEDPTNPATAGTPDAPLAASCDLSAYAGQDIILSFRLMTDSFVQFDGWHIRNLAINGAAVDPTPGDLSDWDNHQFFVPVDLAFKLAFVGVTGEVDEFGHVTDADSVTVVRPSLGAGFTYTLTKDHRDALKHHDQVFALVTGIPDDENADLYFPYSLTIKGEERADGAGNP